MFPIYSPEFAKAEQSYRLESFRRWSRRRGQTGGSVGVDYTPRPEKGHHRRVVRPATSR
jgi:hypothetical protein